MKTIYRITKLELSTLFYSPVAWLVLVIFIFQCSLAYMGIIENVQRTLDLNPFGGESMITEAVFTSLRSGLLVKIQGTLFLYMPLLSMGLMSRELSSGSIKLLFSSPIRISEIVLGKFLSIAIYGFLLILVLLAYAFSAYFFIEEMEIKTVLSGILGLYLLICAYGAIGLFMSCLTSYQVVAAISTLFVLALLRYVGSLGQDMDFIREITYYLSISGRSNGMISGLISSKDVLYYCIVVGLFLGFSILKMRNATHSKGLLLKAGGYMAITVTGLLLIYFTSRQSLTLYLDTTNTKRQTLTATSQEIAKQFSGPLKMTTYVNLMDQGVYYGSPALRIDDLKFMEKFTRFLPGLETEYVYYYKDPKAVSVKAFSAKTNFGPGASKDTTTVTPEQAEMEMARRVAKGNKINFNDFLPFKSISAKIDLKKEEYKMVRVLEYEGRQVILRMFTSTNPPYPTERHLATALQLLLERKGPKIVFLNGNYERSISRKNMTDYQPSITEPTMPNALINNGFTVDTLSLKQKDIPLDAAAVVIADPRVPYTAEELEKIRAYIDRGGNLLINGEPGRQAILNPVLGMLGVKMLDGNVLQRNEFSPEQVLAEPVMTTPVLKSLQKVFPKPLITVMPDVAALEYGDTTGFTYTTIIRTNEDNTWRRITPLGTDSIEVKFNLGHGDVLESAPLALTLTRKINGKEQRIAIFGDADYMTKKAIVTTSNYSFLNGYLSSRLFKWFADERYPVTIEKQPTRDNHLTLTESGLKWMNIIFLWIIPAGLAVFAILFLLRRKRK